MNWFLIALIGVLAVSAFIVTAVHRHKAKKVMKLKAKRNKTKIPYYSRDYQIRYAHVKHDKRKHPHYIYLVEDTKKGKMYYSISLTSHPKKEHFNHNKLIPLEKNPDPKRTDKEYAVKEQYKGLQNVYDKKEHDWELAIGDVVKLNEYARKRQRKIRLKK